MLDRKIYQENIEKLQKMKEEVEKDPLLLAYHIYPETGWLNDPNGLCQLDGTYHFYYQASPLDENRGDIGWGHVSSPDLMNYKREDFFIFPDSKYDKNGAYSGSAFIEDNKLSFFYTGNVKYPGDFDGINEGREHNTLRIDSDAYTYGEKILLMDNDAYPADMTKHVRDPKIYKKDGIYYMFLGARSKDDKGMVLVFKSENLKDFTYHMRIETAYDFGFMWECPDFFDLGDKQILICCPQGLASEKYKYQNIYQSGYFFIDLDLENKTYKLGDFEELDYGFDFYAPQTFEDEACRRILVGWMGIPDADYTNPSVKYKWQHALTIPRELKIKNQRLVQEPIKELEALRGSKIDLEKGKVYEELTFEGSAYNIKGDFKINLRKDVTLAYRDGILSLKMGASGSGRDERLIKIDEITSLRIFSDRSSLEIFINDGAYVMTNRVYAQEGYFKSEDLDLAIYPLGAFTFS